MPDQPSTPSEDTTTASGRIDHWAENHLPCSLGKQPDMLNLPHLGRFTFWGTVTKREQMLGPTYSTTSKAPTICRRAVDSSDKSITKSG